MGETTRTSSEVEVKKPTKEVPFVIDRGYFQHTTGDTYEGFFEAKKKDRSLKMHGEGVYKTAQGDIYAGIWENDRLGANNDVTIRFVDTSTYEGPFKDWCFAGKGKYSYPDGSVLTCEFVDNCPVGNLTLQDPNSHTWLGKSDQGFGWLEPVNHFYAMLESTREASKARRRQSKESRE